MAKQSKSSNKYYLKNRDKILAKLNSAYRSDPEFREQVLERSKRRYHEDEAYRQATIERAKQRYQERKHRESGSALPPVDSAF